MAKLKGSSNRIDPDMQDWQAQQDLRTLVEAHKIRSNKGRHSAAKAYAKRQLAEIQHVTTTGAK